MTRVLALALSLLALAGCKSGGLYASTADQSYATSTY